MVRFALPVLRRSCVPAQDDLLSELVCVVDPGDRQKLVDGGAKEHPLAVLAPRRLALEKFLGLQGQRHAGVFFRERDAGLRRHLLRFEAPSQENLLGLGVGRQFADVDPDGAALIEIAQLVVALRE